jgi:hypothetical protein
MQKGVKETLYSIYTYQSCKYLISDGVSALAHVHAYYFSHPYDKKYRFSISAECATILYRECFNRRNDDKLRSLLGKRKVLGKNRI